VHNHLKYILRDSTFNLSGTKMKVQDI